MNKPAIVSPAQEKLVNDLQLSPYETYRPYIDETLGSLVREYKKHSTPLEVSFRDLVYWVPYSDSLTHYIHSYPAKLLKHIPIFFINSSYILPEKNSVVLDPFCGTGTVLLESIVSGHNALGCDSNPIARLIAEAKTKVIHPDDLELEFRKVIARAKRFRKGSDLKVINADLWFPERTKNNLAKLIRSIDDVENIDVRNFLKVTFSNIVKKVSYSDPRLSVPVRLKEEKYSKEKKEKVVAHLEKIQHADVYHVFQTHFQENLKRLTKLIETGTQSEAKIIGSDARKVTADLDSPEIIPDESVDLVLTSPPYAGAQKYIRSSSLSLGWLGFCQETTLRDIEKENIGREHYSKCEYINLKKTGHFEIDAVLHEIWSINPLRAHICGNYLLEMREAIQECYRVLKNGRYCIIVIGNNEVCKMQFETRRFLQIISEKIGFTTELLLVDSIRSRGLMTKRNKTASMINSEWVLVLRK